MNSKEWQIAKLRSLKPGEAIVIEASVIDTLSSAELARIRLNAVVAQDRKACGDGKWVKRWDRQLCKIPWQSYMSKNPDVVALVKHWEYQDKARYRWQWRH